MKQYTHREPRNINNGFAQVQLRLRIAMITCISLAIACIPAFLILVNLYPNNRYLLLILVAALVFVFFGWLFSTKIEKIGNNAYAGKGLYEK